MRQSVVQIQLHRNRLTLLIATSAPAMFLIEMLEECLPCFLGRSLARHLNDGLRHHRIHFLLIVPTVFYPETCMSVPCSNARTMNPSHTPRMNATPLAHGLVHTQHLLRTASIKVSEEQTIAIHSLIQGLNGGRGTKVGVFPKTELPRHLAVFINLNGLYGGIQRVYRHFIPFVVPVVDDGITVL